MKSKIVAVVVVWSVILLSAPLAEASVKNKAYSLNGFIYSSLLGQQQISGATLTTTTNSFTLCGGGLLPVLSGSINSEQDFGTVAIANATLVVPGVTSIPFTAIQVGNQSSPSAS